MSWCAKRRGDTVELNPETLPKVRINNTYAGMIKNIPAGPDKDYLRDNLQDAKWFLKSLQTRHDTLLGAAKLLKCKDFWSSARKR